MNEPLDSKRLDFTERLGRALAYININNIDEHQEGGVPLTRLLAAFVGSTLIRITVSLGMILLGVFLIKAAMEAFRFFQDL